MNRSNTTRTAAATLITLLLACGSAIAQTAAVKVEGAWARATVQGQKASGAFMKLTAPQGAKLVRVESPVAGVAEVHEMSMDGGVMRMRALPALDLPAGKAVELKPGGYHLMLQDLKAPLAKGTSVPVTLVFQDAKGAESSQQLNVPVDTRAPGGMGAAGMMDAHKH